jgi:site-specific recombinase XerD
VARRGRRGEGSVYYDRATKRWTARFPLGTVDGKRLAKRAKFRTRDEADDELDRMRRLYAAGGRTTNDTLDAYLAAWLPGHRAIRESTRVSYEGHIRLHISPLLGGIQVARLRPSDVRRLITDLERKGASPGTIHLVIRTLSVAMNAAKAERLITDNPVTGVRLPRLDREPVRAMTSGEADAIVDAVTGTWMEYPVRVLLGSGLRRGEVLGLDQRDVFPDFVAVRHSKTKVRAVAVTEDAMDALRSAIAAAPRRGANEPVFFSPRTGDRMLGASLTHALPKLLEARGLGHLAPHALRHGAATIMLTNGADLRFVQEQLGHARIGQTAMYAHVVPTAQRVAVGALERRKGGAG